MTDLLDLPASEQSALLQSGRLSARELLAETLARVETTNPAVNALVTVEAEQAEAAATRADEHFARGQLTGRLHGLPLAIKDLHATAGMRTTCGSPVFADQVPDADELIVERMRAAGAIVFAKTNVPEFGAGSHTFNPVFGVTRNPYDLTRSAGGSSGGAAAALATGMTSLADGSDMGGSLRNPASFCNVVGHRPSPGRVPSSPTSDAWGWLGVPGPMGRTVADTALLLSVQAGADARCPLSIDERPDLFTAPLPTRLDGMRIAVSPDLGGAVPVESAVAEIVLDQVAVLRSLGAEVHEASLDFSGADEVFHTFRALSFELSLGELVDARPHDVKDTIRWNVHAARALTGTDVARANGLRTSLFHQVREFFSTYDALLLPASQVVPFPAEWEYPENVAGVASTTYLDWMRAATLVSATECPATAVPAGFTATGLPIGVQIVTAHRMDLRALQVAHALEQATHIGDRRPALIPAKELS